jgi:putative peptide zinc metalloprotease protein
MALILDYEEMLRKLDLIEKSAAERNLALLARSRDARRFAAEEKAEGFNPFFIPFKVVDPDRFLNRTVKYVRWIWTPPVAAFWTVLAVFTVAVFATHWEPLFTGTYELYAFLRKPLVDAIQFFLLLSIVGAIHELGHAYATKIYGGEVHDIGIALLYFTPAFYCDTTDSLLFPSKWQRLWVTTAGIYIEGFICAFASAIWVFSYPDTLINELAYKTMLFTGISTIFFNINPLVKIDGYYALSSVLEMSELREDSFRYIGACFQKYVLRLPVEVPVLSHRKRRIFWVYGVLALAYTAVIMRFIGGLLFNFYSKYVPDFAVILLLLSLARIFQKRVRLVIRTGRLFYLDKKELLMSRSHRHRLVLVAAAAALVLFVPWTRRTLSAEAVLRPARVARLEAPENGTVAEVHADESDAVAEGAAVFSLSSPAADADASHAAEARARFAHATLAAAERQSASDAARADSRRAAADADLVSQTFRRERLAVKSPIAGTVLTPRTRDLSGRYVQAGSLLAEVGDCSRLVAELPVSERRIREVSVGAPVRALVGQRPLSPLSGRIVLLASAADGRPPTASGLADPDSPPDSPERFLAVAEFENPDGRWKPGDRVRARIYLDRASYAARAWRVLHRWVQTIVW